jgi:serine/threonine protein kinase
VLDFGIAVRSASPSEQTHTITFQGRANRLAGTLGYMAPEVLQGSPATVGSDVWALGVVLYEMVAGRMPFEGKADSDLVASILRDAPAPLPSGTPSGVAWIIERCLEKQPADRPSRAGEVALALEVAEPRPSSGDIAADGSAPVRRRSFRTFTIAAAVLGAVAAATYLAIPNRARPVENLMRFVNPIQVTTAVGVEEFPAWSPDGRTLAYAADPSGHTSSSAWDIWVIQTGGGAPINRTADYKGQDLLPSWSPDGSQIAFWSDRDGPGCYVMPALAGVPARHARPDEVSGCPPGPHGRTRHHRGG